MLAPNSTVFPDQLLVAPHKYASRSMWSVGYLVGDEGVIKDQVTKGGRCSGQASW